MSSRPQFRPPLKWMAFFSYSIAASNIQPSSRQFLKLSTRRSSVTKLPVMMGIDNHPKTKPPPDHISLAILNYWRSYPRHPPRVRNHPPVNPYSQRFFLPQTLVLPGFKLTKSWHAATQGVRSRPVIKASKTGHSTDINLNSAVTPPKNSKQVQAFP